jgi:iron complex outermembrane recepter protein
LGLTTISSQQKNKGFTPKFNLSYEPSSQLTLYATAAQGFRPGGVNQTVPVTGPGSCLPGLQALGLTQAPQGYNADKIWTYEAGEKFRAPSAGITLNASFYYNKWSDIQQLLTLPCGFGYTTNAGSAATYGPEVEASFQLTSELTAQVSGTYTHAKLTSVVPGTGYSVGQQILNIPKYQVTGSLSYSRTVMNDVLMTLRAEDTLVGPAQDVSFSYYRLPSYNLLNLRMQFERDKWSAALYINNVTNEHAQISANNTGMSVNSPALFRIATNQPLTVGVNYNYRF